jgi:hypothetical protein
MSTDSRSSAVTRGNRLLRLSVAITVTPKTVVIRTTFVVRPQSRFLVRPRYYGTLRVARPGAGTGAADDRRPGPLIPPIDAASNKCQIRVCQVTDE